MKKVVLFLCLAILSCTLGPDYEQPTFFTQTEIEKALNLKPVPANAHLISPQDFNDPTLDLLIEKAFAHNPNIRIALTQLRQGRANLRITMAGALPSIDAQASYNYLKESQNVESILKEEYYQVGFDASWEIDIFGSSRRQTEAALANVRASVESLKNIGVSLEAEVAQYYITYRTAQQLLKNAEENLKLQKNIFETVQEKYNAGLADDIALNQAKYTVETTRMQIPTLKTQQQAAANALALLVGQLPGTLDKELQKNKKNLVADVFRFNVQTIYELPADIIRNRPDVRAAEEDLIAQNAAVGVAIADMFPKITLSGLVGFEAVHFSDVPKSKSFTYSVVPGVQMPIFQFGALRQNVALQKAKKEEQLIAYEQSMLQAASDIQNAMTAIAQEYVRNASAHQAYRDMREASRLTTQKYEQGLVDYSEVLDAETRRLSAQTNMVQSNGTLYTNVITFYKAVGGGAAQKQMDLTAVSSARASTPQKR